MTQAQQISVTNIRNAYNDICKENSISDSNLFCSFGLYTDDKESNVIAIYSIIDGIDNEAFPIKRTIEVVIFPDGKVSPLDKIVTDRNALALYMKKLKKLSNNG